MKSFLFLQIHQQVSRQLYKYLVKLLKLIQMRLQTRVSFNVHVQLCFCNTLWLFIYNPSHFTMGWNIFWRRIHTFIQFLRKYSDINSETLEKLKEDLVKNASELLKTHYCVVSNLKKSQHVTHILCFFFVNSKFLQII